MSRAKRIVSFVVAPIYGLACCSQPLRGWSILILQCDPQGDPRLYVCQAPNAFICVSPNAFICVFNQMRLYVCH